MRSTRLAFATVLLLCLLASLRVVRNFEAENWQADFHVYYTAASLVLRGASPHIYDGADTGEDPQLRLAPAGNLYTTTALQKGIRRVRLYVYPPTLAEVLAPVSLLPRRAAEGVWLLLNLAGIGLCSWMLADLLGLARVWWPRLLFALSCMLPAAVSVCLLWGQITLVLLLLWVAGLFCYANERKDLSAGALALATAIKLTPLIVIAPMLLWADWRWLRSFAAGLAACVAAALLISHPGTLGNYLHHVLPAMSRGVPNSGNESLASAVQLLYAGLHGYRIAALHTLRQPVPHPVLLAAKLLGLGCVAAALLLLARGGRNLPVGGRTVALAFLALLSVGVAPVSWQHAYVLALLPLTFLWNHALRHPPSPGRLLLLTVCSVEVSSFALHEGIARLSGAPVAVAVQPLLTPLACIVLTLWFLSPRQLLAVAKDLRHPGAADDNSGHLDAKADGLESLAA